MGGELAIVTAGGRRGEAVMTLDEYVAWAAGVGVNRRAGEPEDRTRLEISLGFASEIGEVAGVLTRWLRDDEPQRDRLADELGDVAYYWARLCVVTGVPPSTLLARSRAHVEWRRAGRPAGGPAPGAAPMALEEYAAWAVGEGAGLADRPDDQSLWDVGLALVGDAGEVVECLRRLTREGDRQRERLAGELGDVWRYWTRLCVASGVTPADVLVRSRARIEGRLTAAGQMEGARPAGSGRGGRRSEPPRPRRNLTAVDRARAADWRSRSVGPRQRARRSRRRRA